MCMIHADIILGQYTVGIVSKMQKLYLDTPSCNLLKYVKV